MRRVSLIPSLSTLEQIKQNDNAIQAMLDQKSRVYGKINLLLPPKFKRQKLKNGDAGGIEPRASRMQRERSTI